MIRLTIHSPSGPQIHLFKKDVITLGKESSGADLTIPEEGLQPLFLNIIQKNGFPIISNLANDPFISLNGHPFGKKLLNHGDIILIRDTEILFENLSTPAESTTNTESTLSPILNIELPFENEVEAFKDDEWQLSHVDQFALPQENLSEQTKPYILSSQLHKNKTGFFSAKKWILFFISSALIISIVIGSQVYRNLNDKSKAHEIMAARAVSDIAMALTHAQLYHLKPGNQNWNDPDFFKSNLKAVLGDQSSYAEHIDLHGNFTCCPYTLRTYTNQDLSRFLLIAQPEPNLFQWLTPKSIILVDSETMELRALSDLRILNRLLANHHPLEDANGKEISRLFKESRLIPLQDLCQNDDHKDFFVPSGLNEMKSGCEHLIYNAPRYYSLSQPLIHKAKNVLNNARSIKELASLKQESETLSSLPYITLYAINGQSEAALVKQSLNTYVSSEQFLIGYLDINSKGFITHSEILDSTPEALDDSINPKKTLESTPPPYIELIDPHHPVYIHLSALANSRERGLIEKAHDINGLLQQESIAPKKDFKKELERAIQSYLNLNSQYEEQFQKTLTRLSQQYKDSSPAEIILFAKVAGFESLIQDESEQPPHVISNDEEQHWLTQINCSATFTALKNATEAYESNLKTNNAVDPDILVKQENKIRNLLLDRIQDLLLSSELQIPAEQMTDEEYDSLKSILNDEKWIHAHEKVYFLNEWEYAKQAQNK